ncbi:MAG: DNA-3-methyladenine glycosylase 2 family protein [Dehalococcoidia bacterium]|nr:DNA-3-methyladenine glycosylase 2 family protein [Dehalococcoidia bacterium]
MQTIVRWLRPSPPFDFAKTLDYLGSSAGTVLESVDGRHYRRAVRLDGNPVLLQLEAAPAAGHGELLLEVTGSQLSASDGERAEALARRMFCLDADVAGLAAAAEADPVFSAVMARCLGLRPVLFPTVFEALTWAIIGQQITVAFAAKCKRALTERYGERLEVAGHSHPLFPEPERLAGLTEGDLAPLQFSRQKSRYIIGLARQVAAGALDLEAMLQTAPEEAEARLMGLMGVGRWTAEYVVMRGLGWRDTIPAGDGGLRRIIGRHYGLGRSATEQEVRALAEAWSGWRGYAALYWWYTLQIEARAPRGK